LEKSEHHKEVHVEGFKADEIIVPKFGEKVRSPLSEGALTQPGGTEKSHVHRRCRRKAKQDAENNVEEDGQNSEEESKDEIQESEPEKEVDNVVDDLLNPDGDSDY
jgi:hypothetical protein